MYLHHVIDERVFKHPVEYDALILQNVLKTNNHMAGMTVPSYHSNICNMRVNGISKI